MTGSRTPVLALRMASLSSRSAASSRASSQSAANSGSLLRTRYAVVRPTLAAAHASRTTPVSRSAARKAARHEFATALTGVPLCSAGMVHLPSQRFRTPQLDLWNRLPAGRDSSHGRPNVHPGSPSCLSLSHESRSSSGAGVGGVDAGGARSAASAARWSGGSAASSASKRAREEGAGSERFTEQSWELSGRVAGTACFVGVSSVCPLVRNEEVGSSTLLRSTPKSLTVQTRRPRSPATLGRVAEVTLPQSAILIANSLPFHHSADRF